MISENQFAEIVELISQSRARAYHAVNRELIDLYWNIGAYISQRIASEGWGKGTVVQLAAFIQKHGLGVSGFSDKNLWRMKQFYEAYKDSPNLSALLRDLNWTNNLTILSRSKTIEENEFYLRLCLKEKFTSRELERQINTSVYERYMLNNAKPSAAQRVLKPEANMIFKDIYALDFLGLPEDHTEKELRKGLVTKMKQFILELGKDFLFMGEEYRVQVGNSDFFIDLLFYHRELACLVPFELKSTDFSPEHLGKLNFYLEALDRDIKKDRENPSIGILLCKNKDAEVVEYAMSRYMSPTLVSEYTTALPDKKILQKKLHELYELLESREEEKQTTS